MNDAADSPRRSPAPFDALTSPAGLDSDAGERSSALAHAVRAGMPRLLDELTDLARIPSVSLRSFDPAPVDASAQRVAELFAAEGLDVDIVRAGGHPAVIGRVVPDPASDERPSIDPDQSDGLTRRLPPVRVLLYAHHDVQPPGDPAGWQSPPFEPHHRGDRLYGRGVADDKAGILAHLAAIRAHGGRPPCAVTVFVEGEEEVGSESLPRLLQTYRDRLDCDVIVLADSMNWAVGTPALTTTLRGNVRVVVTVRTLDHGLHSGLYGGPVPDALTTLCRLLATLHDDAGNVAVPGLTTMADPDLGIDEQTLRSEAGVLDGVDLVGDGPLAARLWTRPSVTVIGLDAPPVDEAANLLTPVARAKISVRIAPDQAWQDAYRAIEEHLRAHVPWGAQVQLTLEDHGNGFVATTSGHYVAAARAAFADAWGVSPVDTGVGASIPFISEFAAAFPDAVILVTGVEDPDTRAHGPDESLHLGEFARVCLAEALLLQRLGEMSGRSRQ